MDKIMQFQNTIRADDIRISIVIPCYNSDESLNELVERIREVFIGTVNESFEVILVDDGSPSQETWQILVNLAERYSEVKAFRFTRNFGKPGALMCGYSRSSGDWVIVMDDDLQHLPEDIPLLLEQRQHCLVMGKFASRKHTRWQKVSSSIKTWFDYKMIGKPKHIYLSPFHMIQRSVIDAMLSIQSPTPHVGALMMHVTRDAVMVDVRHESRLHGQSNFTLSKRIKQFSNLLINNSSFLLRLVAWLGMSLSILSFLYGGYLMLRWFYVAEVAPGWTSLMVLNLLIGGILMLSLGVVGEYLLRIIRGLEHRPPFIIGKSAEMKGDSSDAN